MWRKKPDQPWTHDELENTIRKVGLRIADLKAYHPDIYTPNQTVRSLSRSVENTLREIFEGHADEWDNSDLGSRLYDPFAILRSPFSHKINRLSQRKDECLERLQNIQKRLAELKLDLENDRSNWIGSALASLALHPEIVRHAGPLYRDGHYAQAVETAVKAFANLVRLKSGSEEDGRTLMQTVFLPKKPVLAINPLADDSDRNEQEGFMMLAAGVVVCFRNPRAHQIKTDDPERALEMIFTVSMLAKMLDERVS
jgi:uncharacterized protein (TIGR02391 family)